MIRLAALFWLVLVSATGFAMFAVKYEVQALDDDLAQTAKKAGAAEHEIRVLNAEWAYLNRPDALDAMNQRYLSLVPMATRQLRTNLADIPLRPAPPPPPAPPAPVETVAAETVVAETVAAETAAAPAAAPATPQTAAPQTAAPQKAASGRPAENPAPIVTAALDTGAAGREPARPVLIKAAARPSPPHRATSLDELIARIAAGR